jgi:hypothetical protein
MPKGVTKRDGEPVFLLGPMGIILSIIFFPVGIFILLISTIIYLADWMCYNFNYPRPLCWLFALILGPLFLPLVLLSFLYEMMSGDDTYSAMRYGSERKTKEEKVLSKKKVKKTSSRK